MVNKRPYTAMADETTHNVKQSTCLPMFEYFRQELDEHHDRRERLIKASRDITAASKKIIFTLQRVRCLGAPLPQHVIKANKQYYDSIQAQITDIAKDAQGINFYRYHRQISPGCQEYMEAALFSHYISTGLLLSYEQAAEQIRHLSSTEVDGQLIHVDLTLDDYLLGLFDMTGELMRFAITAMATNGSLPAISSTDANSTAVQRDVLHDMRDLRTLLEKFELGSGSLAKDVSKKMDVMKASVEKIEKSLYGLTVRGAERPSGWMPDLQTVNVEG